MLKQFEKEKAWLVNKTDVPKMYDIFGNEGRQEIIEDYDEEQEKAWRERHREKVKQYRKNLEKERLLEKESQTNSDDEYWQRLELLEIQEELENELGKSTDNSSMDHLQKVCSKILSKDTETLNNDIESETTLVNEDVTKCDDKAENKDVNKMDNNVHQVDEISKVVLLERKSKICENASLDMKLTYDFVSAFDEDEKNKSERISEKIVPCQKDKYKHIENSQKISNVKLLNRESSLNSDLKINVEIEEKPLEINLVSDNNQEGIKIKNQLEENENTNQPDVKTKCDLLEKYKKELLDLRKEIHGAVLKTHDELCKQLDKYDLKEDLEHKILSLQDELNIKDDNVLDSDSSDESIYKPSERTSEKSLKRVSFTEKDHTKYLDYYAPDPPLILHFKHSAVMPEVLESKNSDKIESPHDIYRVFKNCFVQNKKPFKSILKKTASSILKPVEEVNYVSIPGFGDTTKVQSQKQKKTSNPIVSIYFFKKKVSKVVEKIILITFLNLYNGHKSHHILFILLLKFN